MENQSHNLSKKLPIKEQDKTSSETGVDSSFSESEWIKFLSAQRPESPSDTLIMGLADADDAACLSSSDSKHPLESLIAISTDSVCEGVHFSADAPAWWLAQRIVYAGISDLYAVGARPQYILINIVDKILEKQYYREFSKNITEIADRENIALIGGNTSRGPGRQIHITAVGRLAPAQMKSRAKASVGDLIALSGATGEYALARKDWRWESMRLPILSPWLEPVRRVAKACIDVSDGLVGDLGHIITASGTGAHLWRDRLSQPRSRSSADLAKQTPSLEQSLYGGEDYVLCFTINEKDLNNKYLQSFSPIIIGRITAGQGVHLYDDQSENKPHPLPGNSQGFQHFQAQ